MAYNNIDRATTTPNLFPSPWEVLQSQLNRKDRREERDAALNERSMERQQSMLERQERRQDSDRLYNLREIDADTDFSKYQTGEQAFDNYTNNELGKIKSNAISKYINLDPAEMEYRLSQDMRGLMGWHAAGKASIGNIKQTIADLNKTYPNLDLTKAHDYLFNQMSSDFLEQKEGQIFRKDPMLIKQRDYSSQLQDPAVFGQFINDTTPFGKYWAGVKTSPAGEKEYTNNKGKVQSYKWSGAATPYSELVTDDDKKPSGYQMRADSFDAVKGADGKPMKLIKEEDLESMPLDAKAALFKMWGDEKSRKGIGNLPPTQDNLLFRNFAYREANRFLPHGFKTEEIEKIPITRVTNNIGGSKDITFDDVASEIDGALLTKGITPLTSLPSQAREFLGISVNKGRDATTSKDVSKMGVVKANDGTYRVLDFTDENANENGDVLGVFSRKGINLGTNKGGLKVQQKILKEVGNGKQKVYKGLDKNGNPIFE